MVVILAERWDAAIGGREKYAADFRVYLAAERYPVMTSRPGTPTPAGATHILALVPDATATHYQLHGGLLRQAFAADREAIESSVRRLFYNAGLALNRRRQRLLAAETRLFEGTVPLMTFCEGDAERLRAQGIDASRLTVSRPGIDLAVFKPASELDDLVAAERLRLVFVAHNFALKGLAPAIRALAAACRGGVDAVLTVAGRGNAAPFAQLAAAAGVGGRVMFTGPLDEPQLASLLRVSHALLHPTYHDPFPRVVVEALASGCAVITTQRCGAAEIIEHGVQGAVVADPHDTDALAAAIATLADRDRRTAMRHAAAALGSRFDQSRHFREAAHWLFGAGNAP